MAGPFDNLPPEVALEQQRLTRQQQLANALIQNNQQPQGQMIGNRYVAPSFFQNLAPVANMLTGAVLSNKADERSLALAQQLRDRNQKDIEGYIGAMTPVKAQVGGIYGPDGQLTTQTTADMYGPDMTLNPAYKQVAAVEGRGPDFAKAFKVAYGSYDPALKAMALDMIKPQKLAEGETINRLDFTTGQLTPYAEGGTKLAPDVKAAAQLIGLNKPREQWTAQDLNAVNQKVNELNAGKANKTVFNISDIMGKDIGQVKEILNEGRSQVQAGEMSINAANKIDQALKSGNINVGPAANVGQYIGQLGDSLGYTNQKGQDKLVNTRQAIQGLAQMWASSRAQAKGQGTMTEGESQLYGKISSGELDKISIPELKYMVDSTKAQGNYYRQEYDRKLNHLRTIPAYKDVIPLYEVGSMPNIQTKPSGGSANRAKADAIIGD